MSSGKRVLLATEKPFAAAAVKAIEEACAEGKMQLTKLESYKGKDALVAAMKNADAVIVRSDSMTPDVMDGSPVKLIVRAGAGVDTIDLDAASDRDIVVMNTPGQNSNAVAELAFGMMITNARNHYDGNSGYEIKGKSLGLHGFGAVPRNMLRLAKAFEMNVFAYDPFVKKEDIAAAGATPVDSFAELFKKAEFVSLHIPCTPETKSSIKKEHVMSMPPNGVLINTARMEVIDEAGLLEAFKARADLRYLSDVVPTNLAELNATGSGKNPRAFVTPKKMGAQTFEANNNAGVAAAKQIVAFFEENDVKFQVNKKARKA